MNNPGRPRKDNIKPASIKARERSIRKDRVSPERWQEYLETRRKYMRQFRDKNRDLWRKQEREARMRYRHRKLAEKAGRPNPGQCEVCGATNRRMVFDHCHVTEAFRGWLCSQCNTILALCQDNPNVLAGLIVYLTSGKVV